MRNEPLDSYLARHPGRQFCSCGYPLGKDQQQCKSQVCATHREGTGDDSRASETAVVDVRLGSHRRHGGVGLRSGILT